MGKIIAVITLSLFGLRVQAQGSMQEVMEKRARELHRVIGLSDKDQWRKFIRENYSQALIDKPTRSQVSKSDDSGTTSEMKEIGSNLEEKVNMFQRLHNDFGNSKIAAIKSVRENLEMVLSGSGLSGTFNLRFNVIKPYLIDGLGVQAEAEGR
jgi:hypothetical protein